MRCERELREHERDDIRLAGCDVQRFGLTLGNGFAVDVKRPGRLQPCQIDERVLVRHLEPAAREVDGADLHRLYHLGQLEE